MDFGTLGHYQKLGLFAVAALLFIFLAPRAMSVMLGTMAMVGNPRSLPGANAVGRQPERRWVTPEPMAGFAQDAVEAAGGNWASASDFNALFARLLLRRTPVVAREAALSDSTVAWKVAVSEQAALYRVTALAEAVTHLWNARNPIAAALSAQSLLESSAVLIGFLQQLGALFERGDLPAIDSLVMQSGFATGLHGTGNPDGAASLAPPIRLLPAPARAAYTQLRAMANADATAQYRLFGALDKTSTSVSFTATESFENSVFVQVLAGLNVLDPLEAVFSSFDMLVPKIAALDTASTVPQTN